MIWLASLSLGVWVYLIFARGGFWLAAAREEGAPALKVWPDVVAVIPAEEGESLLCRIDEAHARLLGPAPTLAPRKVAVECSARIIDSRPEPTRRAQRQTDVKDGDPAAL